MLGQERRRHELSLKALKEHLLEGLRTLRFLKLGSEELWREPWPLRGLGHQDSGHSLESELRAFLLLCFKQSWQDLNWQESDRFGGEADVTKAAQGQDLEGITMEAENSQQLLYAAPLRLRCTWSVSIVPECHCPLTCMQAILSSLPVLGFSKQKGPTFLVTYYGSSLKRGSTRK